MELKSIDILQDNKFLNFYEACYDDNGKERPYFFASRNKIADLTCVKNKRNSLILPNAIEAFTYIDDDNSPEIIMIGEFRSTINSYIYSFPAGLIEKGETAEDALIREVKEEIGGEISDVKFLQNYPISMCVGITDEANMLALVKLNKLGEQNLDSGEYINVIHFTPDELFWKIKNNEIKLTASGLLGATLILNKLGKNISYLF